MDVDNLLRKMPVKVCKTLKKEVLIFRHIFLKLIFCAKKRILPVLRHFIIKMELETSTAKLSVFLNYRYT